MKRITFLFLLCGLCSRHVQAQPYEHFRYALAGTGSVYLFSGYPYLGSISLSGIYGELHLRNPERRGGGYLRAGLQQLRGDSQSHLAVPVELCYGSDLRIVSMHFGAGGIVHSGGYFLQPAIFFAMHGDFRIKFGRTPIFLELEHRLLGSYAYEQVNGRYYQRKGYAVSLGIGASAGCYIR